MRTYSAREQDIVRKWYVLDAVNRPVGRLAVEVAKILRGKNKPIFTPHVDTGDHVIIINAEKAVLTGTKGKELIYHHSGYPGGIKSVSRGKELALTPEKAIMRTVKGMLPHNKLGAQMLKKLRVYRGAEHPHEAQKPEESTV
ncbi:MAG: 50S ribosomal protein L13 [Armatimonadota bacterium]|nr:50S ribosomal protein L13 [Armatimonadota bacterium]